MTMDFATEAISHFAGLFNLVIESQRGRMEYDDFLARAKQARDVPPNSSDTTEK